MSKRHAFLGFILVGGLVLPSVAHAQVKKPGADHCDVPDDRLVHPSECISSFCQAA